MRRILAGTWNSISLRQDGGDVSLVYTAAGERRFIKGSLGQDGSLFFPNCSKILKFATKANADEMCLFQELPA
jgi:hypothetical protein